LGEPSSGSSAIGNNSWFAADFITGTNTGGYLLDSVQLAIADSSGDPSGFTVMIYSAIIGDATFPGTSLGTLSGYLNPSTAGIYTYTSTTGLVLSPSDSYFIVLTAGTTVANGAYEWSVTSTASPGYTNYHWGDEVFFAQSGNGINWSYASGIYGQFAIDATPVPEPSSSFLLLLGSGVFIYARRTFHR
jgi:PEP-CTERM motif